MIKPGRRSSHHRAAVTRRDILSMAIALAVVLMIAVSWRETHGEASASADPPGLRAPLTQHLL
ncbi:hypothetical protein [Pelagibius sp.]|uniref:hypothetical protein n=1 Tax=Pelagibius sp. TaxID=1931238 RepID=UPI003B505245